MKKAGVVLLTLITLSYSISAFGHLKYWRGNWIGNAFVGASAGYANRKATFRTHLNYGAFPGIPETLVLKDYSDSGFILGVMGGYQAIKDRWMVGGEFNIDWQDIDKEHQFAFSDVSNALGWIANVRYHRNAVYGLSLRLGYDLLPHLLPYVRIGIESGEDKFWTTFTSPDTPYNMSDHERRWTNRFLLGVGAEIPVPCIPLTIRFEYNYHSRGKTLETLTAVNDAILNPSFLSEMQPRTKSGRVVFVWNFV